MWRLLPAILVSMLGCQDGPQPVPRLGTLQSRYRVGEFPQGGLRALLERPSEGEVCFVESDGVHASNVRIAATGPLIDAASRGAEPPALRGTDRLLSANANYAELRVLNADADLDDELLVRARLPEAEGLPPPGTPWRERLWMADDCSGAIRAIVDVLFPMEVPPVFAAETVAPVRAGGDALAIVSVTLIPDPFSYVVTRELAARAEPCRERSCLPVLTENGEPIVGFEFAAWAREDGTVALTHIGVRVTGHLQSEWYVARRDCRRASVGGDFECSPAVEVGLVTKAIGVSALADERAEGYLRVTRGDVEYAQGAVESWTSPTTHYSAGLEEALEVGWAASTTDGSWTFGAAASHSLVVVEQGSRGTHVVGTYDVEGWEGGWRSVLATNPERPQTLVMVSADGVDHHDIVELPRR